MVPCRVEEFSLSPLCRAKSYIYPMITNMREDTSLLRKWGIPVDETCILYNGKLETASHLFFDCLYTSALWNAILE